MVHIEDPGAARGERVTDRGEWQGEEREFLARRVIVKLAAPEAPPESDSAAAALDAACEDICHTVSGGRMPRPRTTTRRMLVELDPGESVIDWAERLSERDDVEYAEPDVIDHATVVPNDPRYLDQWSPGVVNAEAAWDLETGDPGVVIGIIDSGISMTGGALDHPDLDDTARFVLGTDFVDGGTPRDTNGHGTHVVGIAAAPGNNSIGMAGMNWGSLVYICRTLDVNGNGSSADFADAVEEITDYALANGLKAVINYSAGGADNNTKKDACQYASDNGMLLVAATGNDDGGPVIAPASYSTTITGVIAVGSTDDDDTVSSFSNIGPQVTVVAPGRDIFSTLPTYNVTIPAGPDYGAINGTSMATPLVTGLCALMWSRHPTSTNEKIKQCLIDTAVPLGPGGFDNTWGNGRVDAEAALKCGDISIPPSVVGPTCPSRLASCTSRVVVCLPSRVRTTCGPSQLKLTCDPRSRLITCAVPSRLPNLCPTSRFTPDCRNSWVDACPSALDPNCGWGWIDPRDLVVQPELRPGVIQPGPLRRTGPTAPVAGLDPAATVGEDEEVWYDDTGRFWWASPADDDRD